MKTRTLPQMILVTAAGLILAGTLLRSAPVQAKTSAASAADSSARANSSARAHSSAKAHGGKSGAPANVTRTALVKTAKTPEDILLQDVNVSLRKSHEIFTEVWAHIWQDRMQRPMSVFSELGRLVQSHVDPVTGHYLLKQNRCADSAPRASEIELDRQGLQIVGAVFYRLNCAPGKQSERTELARMNFKTSGPKTRADWTFYAENMPRGAGPSLAFLKERIRCGMNLDDRHKLDALECQNIGQNRSTEMHMRFDRFNYKKGSDTLVLVEGKKYKLLTTPVCDEPRFCTQMKVPLVGRIDIFDDVVSDEGRQIQKRNALLEERKAAQVDLEKRLKEQKLAAETAAKDQKTRARRMQVEGQRMNGAEDTAAARANFSDPNSSQAYQGEVVPNEAMPHTNSASALPGTPFGTEGGVIAPASDLYAPEGSDFSASAEQNNYAQDPSQNAATDENAAAEYSGPTSLEEDPAAYGNSQFQSQQIGSEQADSAQTGRYEFNHNATNANQPSNGSGPVIERQAGQGMIR